MTHELTLAYLAGLIDGDGSIIITRSLRPSPAGLKTRLNYNVQLSIHSSVKEDLDIFVETFNIGTICTHKRDDTCDGYDWRISGKEVLRVLNDMYPYIRKKKRHAEFALKFCNLLKSTPGGPRLTDDELNERQIIYDEFSKLRRFGGVSTRDKTSQTDV